MKKRIVFYFLVLMSCNLHGQNNDTTALKNHQFSIGLSVFDYTFREGLSVNYLNQRLRLKGGISYTPFYYYLPTEIFRDGTFAINFGYLLVNKKRFNFSFHAGFMASFSEKYALESHKIFNSYIQQLSLAVDEPRYKNYHMYFVSPELELFISKKIAIPLKIIFFRRFFYGYQKFIIVPKPSLGFKFYLL